MSAKPPALKNKTSAMKKTAKDSPVIVTMERPWFYNGGIAIGALFFLAIVELTISLKAILFPFLMGIIGAYGLNAPTQFLIKKLRLPRSLASSLVILFGLCLIGLITFIAYPFVQRQIIGFARRVPTLADEIQSFILPIIENISGDSEIINLKSLETELKDHLGSYLTHTVQWLLNIFTSGMAIANFFTLLVLTPIVMFYLLNDWPFLMSYINSLLPEKYAPLIKQKAREIHENLGAYVKGQVKVCLCLMVLYSGFLAIMGLKNAVLVGILAGSLSFIPYVGTIMGLTASFGIALSQFDALPPFITILGIFITVSLIETNFLAPRLIGSKIGLPPLGVIFAILAGGTWFGFLGVLLALPSTAVVSVVLRQMVVWYKNTSFYRGDNVTSR